VRLKLEQISRIKSEYSKDYLAKKIKEIRLAKKMTREDLSLAIGKEKQQIMRYESGEHLPPLDVFAKICIALQSDPKDFLNMNWASIENDPEAGFIYTWSMAVYINDEFADKSKKEVKLFWRCSICNSLNIEYDFHADSEDYRSIKVNIKCEHCHSIFDRLMKGEQNISKKISKKIFKVAKRKDNE
jgi:transcriptional regulator with XRE-family HTH domain